MFSLLSPEIVWLLRQARPYFRIQIASVLCIMASSGLSLLDPLVMRWLLDRILPGRNVRGLLVALFLFLAIYLGRFLMSNWGGLLTLKASQKFVLDLRMRLLRHLDRLSADYHEAHSAGASLYLFKEPIDEMSQLGADLLPSALRTGILTAFVLATMLFLNAHLTVTVLPFIPAYLFVTHGYRNRLRDESDLVQQKQESVSCFLQEHFATIVQLQLLSAEKRQQKAGFHFFAETIRAVCKLWKTSIKYSMTSNMIT